MHCVTLVTYLLKLKLSRVKLTAKQAKEAGTVEKLLWAKFMWTSCECEWVDVSQSMANVSLISIDELHKLKEMKMLTFSIQSQIILPHLPLVI